MSVTEANTDTNQVEVESILSASEIYVETLTFKSIAAQPCLSELIIKTQLLTAKNPQEKRVKTRCYVERAQLISLADAIKQFLDATDSSGTTDKQLSGAGECAP